MQGRSAFAGLALCAVLSTVVQAARAIDCDEASVVSAGSWSPVPAPVESPRMTDGVSTA